MDRCGGTSSMPGLLCSGHFYWCHWFYEPTDTAQRIAESEDNKVNAAAYVNPTQAGGGDGNIEAVEQPFRWPQNDKPRLHSPGGVSREDTFPYEISGFL